MPAFRPGLWPTLTVLFALPVLLMLGTWQVKRLEWKSELIASMEARSTAPPTALPSNTALEPTLDYRHVEVQATLQSEPALRFGLTRLQGAPAHNVLQLATLADGRHLVVDRGAVSADTALPPTPEGERTLDGYVRWIGDDERQWPVPPNEPDANRWYWYDRAALEDVFGVQLLPVVLVLAPTSTSLQPAAPVPQPLAIDLPNNHLGYAITWYGLAVSLVVIYGVYGHQRGKGNA